MGLLDAIVRPRSSDTPVLRGVAALTESLSDPSRRLTPDNPVIGSFLCLDPPIFFCTPQPKPFGPARWFADRFPGTPFVFLSPLLWNHEAWAEAVGLALQWRRFRRAHPATRLIVLANTPAEADRLRSLGVEVQLAPRTMFTEDAWFQPLPDRPKPFDAVYTAQLAPFKRHALARLVESCAYVTYVPGTLPPDVRAERIGRFVGSLPPRHVLMNKVGEAGVERMNHLEVNEVLASAHVGLCLSRTEGMMFASVEYLLAGLPVVSTPSSGGRDTFFHPDTTLIVPADPREVRDGVAAMKARGIPAEVVRATTLALITKERELFNTFMENLMGRQAERTDPRWSFPFTHKLAYMRPLGELERELMAARGGSHDVLI